MCYAYFKLRLTVPIIRVQSFIGSSAVVTILLLSAAIVASLSSGLSDMDATATVSKHSVFLKLSAPTSLPWGRTVSFTAILTDTTNTKTPIEGALIRFEGSGVRGDAYAVTDSTGKAIWTGTAPSIVDEGWTVQARYDGDSQYYSTDSSVKEYSTVKHNVDLLVSVPDSKIPWGTPTSFTATLRDTSTGYTPVAGAAIQWDGTGAKGPSNQKTNANGNSVWTGTAPSILHTGWTVQAQYVGNAQYNLAESPVEIYSTTPHSTFLSLTVSPKNAVVGNYYKVTGILNDNLTNSTVAKRTISFRADSPVTIPDATTDSSGKYTVSGLTAPRVPGLYFFDAKFKGDPLYNASSSDSILIVSQAYTPSHDIAIQPSSYIVHTNGTMIYARNTTTGVDEFKGGDASRVINKAINATQSGSIHISEGQYVTKSTIRPKSDTQIIGDGINNTFFTPLENRSLIVNAHPNDPTLGIGDRNIVLGNFTINYEGVGGGDAINLVSVEKSRIFQLRIENISRPSDAIEFDGCNNIIVESVQFFNIGGSAIQMSDSYNGWGTANHKGSNNITVIDAYASNVGKERKVAAFNAFARDTAISGTNNITFTKILVENSYSGFDFAKFGSGYKVIEATILDSLSRGIAIRGMNNIITNATIFNTGSHGILASDSQNITIGESTIFGSKGNNIAITDSVGIKIINNTVGNKVASKFASVSLTNTFRSTIEGIVILNNSQVPYIVEEKGGSDYNKIIISNQFTMPAKKVGAHTTLSGGSG
jgi:hypothetical protein